MVAKLEAMSEQSRIERLANSTSDEASLAGYVGDIYEALIDYQVRSEYCTYPS